MTLTETHQLLYLFSEYWPTFGIKPQAGEFPGTAAIWFQALEPYSIDHVRRALMQFRGDKERTFAPTLSELEGTLREFQTEDANALRAKELLEYRPPQNEESTFETYYREVIVGRNKDGTPIIGTKPYIRATRAFRNDYFKNGREA